MNNFVRLLAPIYSAINVSLVLESNAQLSKPELIGLIELFTGKIQMIFIDENVTFSTVHERLAIHIKEIILITIAHEMAKVVWFFD